MSEYWKSTPKYWCKFCSDFVKDTPFSRKEHDATPKHQRSIQRSLRDLHRGQEREEREKQRAQAEIARLNGVVPSTSTSASASASAPAPWKQVVKKVEREAPKQTSAEERKQQIRRLAEMGVAVPEEFRKEMAMAGSWEVTAVRSVRDTEEDVGKFEGLSVGVRKRKVDEEEEEAREAEERATRRKGWGQAFKTFPGSKTGEDDLDALMAIGSRRKVEVKEENGEDVKVELQAGGERVPAVKQDPDEREGSLLKEEPVEKELGEVPVAGATPPETKVEEKPTAPAVVFKKRKKAAKPT